MTIFKAHFRDRRDYGMRNFCRDDGVEESRIFGGSHQCDIGLRSLRGISLSFQTRHPDSFSSLLQIVDDGSVARERRNADASNSDGKNIMLN